MEWTIRRARPDDSRAIHDAHMRSIMEICSRDYTPEQLVVWGQRPFDEARRLHTIKHDHVWVAECSGNIGGYVHLVMHERDGIKDAFLNALYLVPEAGRLGLGRELLQAAEAVAKEGFAERIELMSTLTSFEFYRHLGYHEVALRDVVEMGGVKLPVIPMEKYLGTKAPPELRFVLPNRLYEQSFLSALDEMDASEQRSWLYMPIDPAEASKDFGAYVDRMLWLNDNPPSHFVEGEVFWALRGDEIVGRVGLRHRLNDQLEQTGGHVGYIVRPSARGQGIGGEMLRQTLLTPAAKRMGRLLITCDDSNLASIRTILKNGGIFSKLYIGEGGSPRKQHYWINLTQVPTLHTARLELTRLRAEHAADLFTYASDPEVAATVTWTAHSSIADSQAFIAFVEKDLLSNTPDKQFLLWALYLKESDEVVGTIQAIRLSNEEVQIDYALSREHWNKGLMTEAAGELRDWIWRSMPDVKRIRSGALTENAGSRRVMEKVGMTLERITPNAMSFKGRQVDLAYYLVKRPGCN